MNKLFLIVGPSGSGKTSIMRQLMDNEIVSHTTRAKRSGEIDGKDYYFVSKYEFLDERDEDRFVEYVWIFGNYYGIHKDEIDEKIRRGDAYVIVTWHGAEQIMNYYPNCTTIFLYAGYDTCYQNMIKRGDREEKVLERLRSYDDEMQTRFNCDYVVRNNPGRMRDTINIIQSILIAERTTPVAR